MRNLTSEFAVPIGNRSIITAFLFLLITFILCPNKTEAQKPKILLEQSANGPADAPLSSPQWTKNHLSKNNSHYAPGSVIPYRAIVTDIPINCPLKIRLNFLAIKKCRHAIDFLTNYNQFTQEHFLEFGSWEPVDPLAGLTGNFSSPANFAFPVFLFSGPIIVGPPADLNTPRRNYDWFLANYGPQSLSAWNAALSGIVDLGSTQHNTDCVTANGNIQSCNCLEQQTFEVSFTATSLPVVFAWGGHAAYDTLTKDPLHGDINGNFYYGYQLSFTSENGYQTFFTTERGSSGVGGVTKCLTQAQAAAIGGGNDDASFDGGGGDITYNFSSGGKPINPTSSNNSELQREENAIIQKASVFPNPNNGSASVTLPFNSESFEIRLTDVTGRIIKKWSEYKNQRLELTALKSGIYFLNIISRDSKYKSVLKVIVLN